MKSKIVQFKLTHNGIVVLCEDGSLWSCFLTDYIKFDKEKIEWNLICDSVKINVLVKNVKTN